MKIAAIIANTASSSSLDGKYPYILHSRPPVNNPMITDRAVERYTYLVRSRLPIFCRVVITIDNSIDASNTSLSAIILEYTSS